MPDLQTLSGSTTENPKSYPRETFTPREVSRLVDRVRHQPGMSVANFRGDAEEMLADGEFYGLDARDLRFLAHALRACIRRDEASPEGAVVSLSNRQWGAFVGIRRKFLWHRREPSNLINLLRSRRAETETRSTRVVPARAQAATITPIIKNETAQ